MVHVVFSDEALQDLREHWIFVARSSHEAADRLVEELIDRSQELSTMAERFRKVPRPAGRELRRRNVRTWAIFYRITPTHVEIVRIVHGGRNLDGLRL